MNVMRRQTNTTFDTAVPFYLFVERFLINPVNGLCNCHQICASVMYERQSPRFTDLERQVSLRMRFPSHFYLSFTDVNSDDVAEVFTEWAGAQSSSTSDVHRGVKTSGSRLTEVCDELVQT